LTTLSGRVVPVAVRRVVHPECGDPRPPANEGTSVEPRPAQRTTYPSASPPHTRRPHRRAIVAVALLVFATIGIAAAAAASAGSGFTATTDVEVEGSTGTWPAFEAKLKAKGKVAPLPAADAQPGEMPVNAEPPAGQPARGGTTPVDPPSVEPPGTGEQPTGDPTTSTAEPAEDRPPPGDGSDGGDTGPPPAGEPEDPPTETQ
jgi:hypothetical protein